MTTKTAKAIKPEKVNSISLDTLCSVEQVKIIIKESIKNSLSNWPATCDSERRMVNDDEAEERRERRVKEKNGKLPRQYANKNKALQKRKIVLTLLHSTTQVFMLQIVCIALRFFYFIFYFYMQHRFFEMNDVRIKFYYIFAIIFNKRPRTIRSTSLWIATMFVGAWTLIEPIQRGDAGGCSICSFRGRFKLLFLSSFCG